MGWIPAAVAAVGAGSQILGGIMGGKSAAGAQQQAQADEERAMQFQQGVYNTAQTNISPWITGGQEALGGLEQFMGLPNTAGGAGAAGGTGAAASYNQFTKTPFYTFPLASNIETMDRTARQKGLGLSTGEVASLGKTAGDYSAANFGSYLTALQGLSGMGMSGSTQLGNIGVGVGQQVGQTATQLGGIAIGGAAQQQAAQNQMFNGISNLFGAVAGGANSLFGPGGGTGSSYGGANAQFPSGNVTGNQNNWGMLPASGWGQNPGVNNPAGNTWYNNG